MDYEQYLYGRTSYDPAQPGQKLRRNGGMAVKLVAAAIAAVALALAISVAVPGDAGTADRVGSPSAPIATAPITTASNADR